jgi:hypothetical protein
MGGAVTFFSNRDARRRRLLLLAAWLGVAMVATLASTVVAAGANAQATSCSSPVKLKKSNQPRSVPPTLAAADGASILMRFDDSRAADSYFVPLKVWAEEDLTTRDFVQQEGFDVLFTGGYLKRDARHRIALNDDGVRATLVPVTPRRLDICFAVDPDRIGGLGPGTYRGTVAVVYGIDQTPLASVPVELTFRASRWLAIGIALVAVALGLAVKVLSDAATSQREGKSAGEALRGYVSQLTFPALLILALVAGILAFLQMYGGSPDWGSTNGDLAKLFALCFIAQMSTNEGVDVVRRVAGGGSGVHTSAPSS